MLIFALTLLQHKLVDDPHSSPPTLWDGYESHTRGETISRNGPSPKIMIVI